MLISSYWIEHWNDTLISNHAARIKFWTYYSFYWFRMDDPLMWGLEDFPTTDPKLGRWVLAAEDICFKNSILSYFFRIGAFFFSWYHGSLIDECMTWLLSYISYPLLLHNSCFIVLIQILFYKLNCELFSYFNQELKLVT